MSYQPQPGTFAFRAIEYLKTLPPGTEVATAILAEALGQPSSAVMTLLQPARTAGAVLTRRDDHGRRMVYWRLPIGDVAADEPQAEETDAHKPVQVTLKPGQWPPVKAPAELEAEREMNAVMRARLDEMPVAKPEPAPTSAVEEINTAQAQAPREQHVVKRVWFCSDGQLVLETAEHEFLFDRLEARQLLRSVRELGELAA